MASRGRCSATHGWRNRLRVFCESSEEGDSYAPFKFNPPDWFMFFAQHAWRFPDLKYFADEAERLRRPLSFL